MMKLLFIFCLFVQTAFGQVNFGGNYHHEVINSAISNFEIQSNGITPTIKSFQYELFVEKELKINEKITIPVGINYRFINYTIENYIQYYDYFIGTTNLVTDYPPFDLKSISNNFGLRFGLNYSVLSGEKSTGSIGTVINSSIFEMYKSSYTGKFNQLQGYPQPSPLGTQSEIDIRRNEFHLSIASLDLFYKHQWNISEKSTFGLRASLGTNLYSDWDVFKKSAWVSLGLEFSIK